MVNHPELNSIRNHDRSPTLEQVDGELEQLRHRVALLERENRALWTDLQACQRSQSAQAQVAELERAYAVLQAEVRERHRCEQELQEQAAIACEQEKAAQERAAELAKANEALRIAIAGLAELTDLDCFLTEMLKAAVSISEAYTGTVCLFDNIEHNYCYRFAAFLHAGEIVDPQSKEWQSLLQPNCFPPETSAYIERIRTSQSAWIVSPDAPEIVPEFRTYHQASGHRVIAHIPLKVEERLLGFLGLAFREESISTSRFSLLEVLADQMVMAIEFIRLAEEAKQTAIAREQEKAAQERAAELAKANEALQESLSKLANEPDLDRFLGHVLTVCAERLGAIGAGVWQDEGGISYLIASYEDGKVNLPPESSHPGRVRSIVQQTYSQNYQNNDIRLSKGEILAHYEEDFQTLPEYQPYVEYLKQRGIEALLSSPRFLGDSYRGALTLRFDHRRVLKTEEKELAFALANQATLALELTRLAEEAKQTAIAREQEKAAQERAAELARANIALRQSIDALTTQPSIEASLSVTLQAIAEVLEVPSACLWKYEGEWMHLQLVYQDGSVIPAEESNHPNARSPYPLFPDAYDSAGKLRTQPSYYLVEDPSTQITDDGRSMLQQLGVRCVMTAPIVVSSRAVGYITARLTHDMPDPSPARLELVNALANQAALALQMAQLAEEAKQAAIAREQEKAAQERAAELAKANEALQESLSKLADEPELDKFLGHVLTVCAERLGAIGAGIWQMEKDEGYLIASYEDGKVNLSTESSHPGAVRATAQRTHKQQHSQNDTVRLSKGEIFANYEENFQEVPDYQPYLEYLQQRGIKTILRSPMFLGDSLRGTLTLRFDHRRVLKTEEAELAHALANQAMLALELTRLAEEAKQAAIAREQEKAAQERAAELAKANEALQESLSKLADEPELDKFLGHVLTVCAERLGAIGAGIWQFQDEIGYLIASYEDGKVNLPSESPHPGTVRAIAQQSHIKDSAIRQSKGEILAHYEEDFQALPNFKPYVDYLQRRGIKTILSSPMFLGDTLRGSLTVRFDHRRFLKTEEAELTHALSNQAMLALELTRLAKEAQQAAIAREQEKAAQERAAELAKANAALRQSIDALTTQPTIEAFLSVTLQAIAEVLEVPSACLWKYDDELAHLQLVYQDKQVFPAEQTNHVNARQPVRHQSSGYDSHGKIRTRPFYYSVGDPTAQLTDEQQLMFQQLEVRCMLIAPIVIGDRAVGSISARLTHEMPDPSPARLELVNALANQAALALQMSQLAEEAQQAVVLEERNRMAREIHDTLAQSFTGVIVQLEAAKRKIDPVHLETVQSHFARARNLATTGLAEARRSVRALRPGALESDDLPAALQRLAEQMNDDTVAQINFQLEGEPRPLPTEVETNLLRIGQEALTNALRHANAHTIQLKLLFESTTVYLSIEDNGQGFDPQQPSADHGFGLIGMQERSDRMNGQLSLISERGHGTTVTVMVMC